MPTLEDALLGLLDRDQETEPDEALVMEGALR
jgi:hypothetical protein